jgi:hypothetical protein
MVCGWARAIGLILLATTAVSCHQKPAPVKQPETRAVPRLLVYAPNLQLGQPAAPEQPETPPAPTAAYASLGAACDAVEQFMKAHLGVAVKRANSVTFQDDFWGARRRGCELSASGNLERMKADTAGSRNAAGDFGAALTTAGWVQARYSADGPDGSVWSVRSRETLCVVNESWDGGDDSDSTYVPSDESDLVTRCSPLEPGDSA